jgi:nucleotide sugar dehydrogenase
MKVGVAGIGCVGTAVVKSLSEKFQGTSYNVVGYDKYKGIGTFEELLETDFVFLCLPTLYRDEISMYDKTSIHEVCQNLANAKYTGIVIIKSTVEPTTSQTVSDQYNLSVLHNPEFLTAKTAYQDFHQQSHVIIGTTTRSTDEQVLMLSNFYLKFYPDAYQTIVKSVESESIKIFCNTFYSVKIQYFNELYLLTQKIGADYPTVVKAMLQNGWINEMHTQVPGTDGLLSYGGMCFPKDTSALLSFMKLIDTPHRVLEATVTERNSMRND